MPRACKVCRHAERPAIDSALVAGAVSFRDISKRYGLTPAAVWRHGQGHLPASLLQAKGAAEAAAGDALLARLEELSSEARRLGQAAELNGDIKTALAALRELARHLELLARMEREGSGGMMSAVAVRAMMDRAAAAVIKHVASSEVLDKIQADWDRIDLQ